MSLKISGEKKLVKVGPFGSDTGGKAFDHGAHSTVRQVVISITSKMICSVEIEYDDNGISVWPGKFGNKDAPTYVHTIKFDYPNEYLVSVRGRWESSFWHSTFISSLIFGSNKNSTYGPYGDAKSDGKYFSIHAQGNMIVGFHGRASDEWAGIRAIGAYLKPLDHHSRNGKVLDVMPELGNPTSPLQQTINTPQTKLENKRHDDEDNKPSFVTIADNQIMGNEGKEMSLKNSCEKKLVKVGPFGSDTGGRAFDHGAHSTVRQLVISITSKMIRSIQIEYDDNGFSVWPGKLGNNRDKDAPTYVHTIKLDYPNEYLVSVCGRLESSFWHPTFVSFLIFRSNKNTTYGPYGDAKSDGKYFSIHAQENMIVGFHGRASDEWAGIRAIGAYLKPLDHHSQNENSKVLDVLPELGNLSSSLQQARFTSQTKLKNKRDDDEDNKQSFVTIDGNRAIGAYMKPLDHHSRNGKVLDVVPELGNPSSPLQQARYTSQTKLKNKRDDDEDNKQFFVTIAGNQVIGNEGKEMGSFIVGNKLVYKTITHYY